MDCNTLVVWFLSNDLMLCTVIWYVLLLSTKKTWLGAGKMLSRKGLETVRNKSNSKETPSGNWTHLHYMEYLWWIAMHEQLVYCHERLLQFQTSHSFLSNKCLVYILDCSTGIRIGLSSQASNRMLFLLHRTECCWYTTTNGSDWQRHSHLRSKMVATRDSAILFPHGRPNWYSVIRWS